MKNENLYKCIYNMLDDRKIPFIIISICCILYRSISALLYSYVYKCFFNSLEYHNFQEFLHTCMLCIFLCVIDYFSVYLFYYKMKQVRIIVFKNKLRMFHKLIRMDIKYFENNHSGDILKRLNLDANSMKDFYYKGMHYVIELMCTGVVSLVMMLFYNWELSIISIIFSIISVKTSLYINKVIKTQNQEIQKKLSHLSARLSDLLSGFVILKLFSGSQIIINSYNEKNNQVSQSEVKRAKVLAKLEMCSFLTGMIGSFGTIIVGVFLVSKSMIDYGTIMAIVALQLSLSNTMQAIGGALAHLNAELVCVQRIDDFLQLTIESGLENDINKSQIICKTKGIEMQNVKFNYHTINSQNKQVLKNINLYIHPKEHIMLVGNSGCGKSTILKLLLGFYQIDSGEIKIFGKSIKEYKKQQLRSLITYVPQESYLFEGTIFENIQFGNIKADYGQVISAAKLANVDEFVDKLPRKYETNIVSGGKNLSGGQRQRIAIARAFLKNSPIILLDEPTSALDVESEGLINNSLMKLINNKLVIMVTHRTSPFGEFDRIITLK